MIEKKSNKGAWIALILAAESILAIGITRRQPAAGSAEPTMEEEAAVIETTPPPEPLTLSQLLGVSADDWALTLVRSDRPLSPGYIPELAEIEGSEQFDKRACDQLRILIAEARADV